MSRQELYQGYKNYETSYDNIQTEMLHRAAGNQPQQFADTTFADLGRLRRQVVVDIIQLRQEVQALYGDGDFGHEKSIQNWQDILGSLP
ncbi:hypothetical protein BBK36DRAFT_1124679 [Trichoderma citrinoviride]|uniref:Uncharacterized protein n=1 Tax=Trichoderma citrinoviride TaxID=58853 RepID=A0A2T4B597_9HYPO|nr:hypothetical protein BBK36DRAFT_1124679 [Trichoderma citrinoviride]PTB64494.1 hypothetical protein BBK36DRAFT_1124679 [Trichoderma citrinoviride]